MKSFTPPAGPHTKEGIGHGSQFGRKREEALAALLTERNVEEAALKAGIGAQTLYRWLKMPAFQAAYQKALQATFRQSVSRLQQAAGAAVTILLKVIYDPRASRSARLHAADRVLSHAKVIRRIGDVGARLQAVSRAREGSNLAWGGKEEGAAEAKKGGSSRPARGIKRSRKWDKAIVALLTKRNVEEAAQAADIGTTTLYRWLKDPAFEAAYRAARLEAFGQAGGRLQQASSPAATVILKMMFDADAPAEIHTRAAHLALKHAIQASEEDSEAWVSELGRSTPAAPGIPPGARGIFEDPGLAA